MAFAAEPDFLPQEHQGAPVPERSIMAQRLVSPHPG
jgi:hypothetical protein